MKAVSIIAIWLALNLAVTLVVMATRAISLRRRAKQAEWDAKWQNFIHGGSFHAPKGKEGL